MCHNLGILVVVSYEQDDVVYLKKQFIGGIYSRGRESLYILYASMITCKIHYRGSTVYLG